MSLLYYHYVLNNQKNWSYYSFKLRLSDQNTIMKEITTIINAFNASKPKKLKFALATVVKIQGSSYRRMGARMLVCEDGNWVGGISGGCLEGDALRRALKAIHMQHPSIVTYDTSVDDDHQVGVGLGCKGVIDVLFQPIESQDPYHPIALLASLQDIREPQVVLTMIQGDWSSAIKFGTTLLLSDIQDTDLSTTIEAPVENALARGKSSVAVVKNNEGHEVQLFIEVIKPALRLFILGGNYDIYPLIRIGRELGWHIYVQAKIKQLHQDAFDLSQCIYDLHDDITDIDGFSTVILMSHDLKTDKNNLKKYMHSSTPYIGMLGPRDRSERILNELENEEYVIPEDLSDRLYFPVGLDIGAINPEEIAIAICAEIIAHFSGRDGRSLKYRQGKIYP